MCDGGFWEFFTRAIHRPTFPHQEKSLASKPFWGVLAEFLKIEIEIFFENLDYRASTSPARLSGEGFPVGGVLEVLKFPYLK